MSFTFFFIKSCFNSYRFKHQFPGKLIAISALFYSVFVAFPEVGRSQIIPANDGTNTIITPEGNRFDIEGGQRSGDGRNLFHSFQEFGLSEGQIANFLSSPDIQNIFGQVVGSNASYIDGMLQISGGNANLYLINPAGIVFGANASLNVPADFTATTATGIGFGENLWLNASGNHNWVDLLGNPTALDFANMQNGAIVNFGNLAVTSGNTLNLVGGTIVNLGTVNAPNGTLHLTTIPGTNLVRLSAEGNVLSLDISPNSGMNNTGNPLSLPQLLTGYNGENADRISANPDGTVNLTGSGLQIENGDVVARNITANTIDISAQRNLNLFESQLFATGNLNLFAGNTVIVRDSLANPFIAQSGENLTIRGDRTVDIFALNHPDSGLFSGGNLVLRSPNPILGDAHYTTGGNFAIEQLDGQPGSFWSPTDPVIRASGDVSFSTYRGASLHIFAGGRVDISGSILITSADANFGLIDTVMLSNGTVVNLNSQTRPTLDIRAGTIDFGTVGNTVGGFFVPNPPTTVNPATNADINIGSIQVTAANGLVLLTNQFAPDTTLSGGNIQVGNISTSSPSGNSGDVFIDARGNLQLGNVNTFLNSSTGTEGGTVEVLTGGNIVAGAINTSVSSFFFGTGESVRLDSGENLTVGAIDTSAEISEFTGNVTGGQINLIAGENITFATIDTHAQMQGQGNATAGRVNLLSEGLVRGTGTLSGTTINSQAITFGTALGGAVTIQHDGGTENIPFIIGDASLNGTAGAIRTGSATSLVGDEFPNSGTETRGSTPTINGISVAFLNTPPTLNSDINLEVISGESVTFNVADLPIEINDADGDTTEIEIVAISSGTLTRNGVELQPGDTISVGDELTYTPADGTTGNVEAFRIAANDRISMSETATISTDILTPTPTPTPEPEPELPFVPTNQPPTLTIDSQLPEEGKNRSVTFTLSQLNAMSSDPDGDRTSITFQGLSRGTLTRNGVALNPGDPIALTDELTYTPPANSEGSLGAFTIAATDGKTLSPLVQIFANILPNQAPILTANSQLTEIGKNQSIDFTLTQLNAMANDPDGDRTSLQLQSITTGTLTRNGTVLNPGDPIDLTDPLTYTPPTNSTGSLGAFEIAATDGTAFSSPVQVVANIRPNQSPTLTLDSQLGNVQTNGSIAFTLADLNAMAIDVDGDSILLQLTENSNGILTQNGVILGANTPLNLDDVLVYSPPENSTGVLSAFAIVASDGMAVSDPVSVSVNILENPSPPPETPTQLQVEDPTKFIVSPIAQLPLSGSFNSQYLVAQRLPLASAINELTILPNVLPGAGYLMSSPQPISAQISSGFFGGGLDKFVGLSDDSVLFQVLSSDIAQPLEPPPDGNPNPQPSEPISSNPIDVGSLPPPEIAPGNEPAAETPSSGETGEQPAPSPRNPGSPSPDTPLPDDDIGQPAPSPDENQGQPSPDVPSENGENNAPTAETPEEASPSPAEDADSGEATPAETPESEATAATPTDAEVAANMDDCQKLVSQIAQTQAGDRNRTTYSDLVACYQQNLNVAKSANNPQWEAYALNNLGVASFVTGNYTESLEYHRQHLDLARQSGNILGQGLALAGIGAAYGALGDYDRSIEYYQWSIALLPAESAPQWKALALRNLGSAYLALGKPDQAIQYQEDSLTLARSSNDRYGEAQALGNLGNTYAALGNFDRALDYQQQSLQLSRDLGDPLQEAQILLSLGTTYTYRQEYDKAIEYHQQSLILVRELKARLGEGIALNNLGDALLRVERFAESEGYLFESIEVWESLRAGLGNNDTFKVSIFETQEATYRNLQEVLVKRSRPETALEIAERGRARAFIELVARRFQQPDLAQEPPQIDGIQHIARSTHSTLVAYTLIRDQFAETPHGASPQYPEPQDSQLLIWVVSPDGTVNLRQADLTGISVEDLVATSRELLGVRGIGIAPRQAFSPGMRVRLNSDAPNSEPWEIIAVAADTQTLTLKLPSWDAEIPPIQRPFADVATTIESPNTPDPRLQQLYQFLIEPIADLLPADPNAHLAFIPHRELFLVPFAALQDPNGHYLIENHTVLSSPSIQVLGVTDTTRGASPGGNPLVVGNPTMPKIGNPPQPLPPLPSAELEAVKIAEILETQALTGDWATETAIRQQLPTASIIHLATHGLLDDRQGIGSAIALTPSNTDDGWLSAEELLNLNLNAQLAVLSACNTGQGRITGDGVIGLSRSLISAGVPSVIVSLWAVPDAPTADLMVEFYQNWQQNPDKARALRGAMLATMKQHPHPRNWAAFLLMGNG
ncbi:MAG TPA: CHAT domain-containing protein [Oscillatoriales cyanobacterium M59_W2019_021]|nr:CHAT domain-containing protein [Oscillatoriales cyanobacterium M59_W2019_021]